MRKRYLSTGQEWNMDFIEKSWKVISKLATKYKWEGYQPQFEITSFEHMIDNYVFTGMPAMYSHWSFGEQKAKMYDKYIHGRMGLALEMIINSDPAICYLSEDNSACEQLLVMCHAAVGHSHFFKNNHLFKDGTDPKGIVDYVLYARDYIENCEQRYGENLVEVILDAAHSLRNHGIDKHKRPADKTKEKLRAKLKLRLEAEQENVNELYANYSPTRVNHVSQFIKTKILANPKLYIPSDKFPEENLLYFIEKNSPILTSWQREILRIVRTLSQYFYPQMQTKVMNEGFASFVHFTLMNDLYDAGYVPEGYILEFCHSHSDVLHMLKWNDQNYHGLNPYKLGFEIFRDIRRMCEHPTPEDKHYFPELANQNWIDVVNDTVANYRDESFIKQFLSPSLVRKLRLFMLSNLRADLDYYHISGIQSDEDFEDVRTNLSAQFNISGTIPTIEVWYSDFLNAKDLVLVHTSNDESTLNHDQAEDTVDHVAQLWGKGTYLYNVKFEGDKYVPYGGYYKKHITDEQSMAIRGYF